MTDDRSSYYLDRDGVLWDVVGDLRESVDRTTLVLRRVPEDRAAYLIHAWAKEDGYAASAAVSERWSEILADPDHPPSLAAVIALDAVNGQHEDMDADPVTTLAKRLEFASIDRAGFGWGEQECRRIAAELWRMGVKP